MYFNTVRVNTWEIFSSLICLEEALFFVLPVLLQFLLVSVLPLGHCLWDEFLVMSQTHSHR